MTGSPDMSLQRRGTLRDIEPYEVYSPELLQQYCDAIIVTGLREVEKMLVKEEQKDYVKIKALSAVTSVAKFVDKRLREDRKEKEKDIEDDMGDILGVGEVVDA